MSRPCITNDAAMRWTTAEALASLAAHGMVEGSTFTTSQLREWVPLDTAGKVKYVTRKLVSLKFVDAGRALKAGSSMDLEGRYTVTLSGAAAIKSAGEGHVRKSGNQGQPVAPRPPAAGSLAMRVWALLRARKVLDAGSASETLCDAGDDVAAAAKTITTYLRRWAKTSALQASARRLPNGFKQYVLVKDSPEPPAWTAHDPSRRKKTTTTE